MVKSAIIAKHKRSGEISKDFADAAKKPVTDCRGRALSGQDYHVSHYESDMTQERIYAEVKKQFTD